jgi:hypothetical protein
MRPTQTTFAFLPSAGYNFRKATKHLYNHSELVTLQVDGSPITGLGHFFRCVETNELRRWGFDVTFAKDTGAN